MNVLEEILEELEKEQNSYEADHAWNYSKGLEYAKEIIRSHMNELPNGIKEVSKEQLDQVPVAAPEFLQECKATAEKYDKLKFYEDLEEQERLLIQAFTIESTAECPDCGYSGIMISETWIRPELLQHDRFYATRSEAEQALKKWRK